MPDTKRRRHVGPSVGVWLLVLPALAIILFLLVPLAGLLKQSVYAFSPDAPPNAPHVITAANYLKIFSEGLYLHTLWVTVKLSVLTTLVALALGLSMAFWLARTPSRAVRTSLIILTTVPFLVSFIIKLYAVTLVLGNTGLVNTLLRALGLIGANDFLPLMRNEFGVVFGLIIFVLPFIILTLAGPIRRLDVNLERAAQNLGADRLVTFRKVTLPLLMSGLINAAILSFALASVAFATPLILGGGAVVMIANAIYDQALSMLDTPFAAALAVVALTASLAILLAAAWLERLYFNRTRRAGTSGK